jgi:hypothetical protein
MSSEFFNRKFEILVDGKPVITDERFRVIFQVTQDYGGFVSYCDLSIYGLSDDSIGKLNKENIQVSLKAGYENNIDFIFKGILIRFIQRRTGPDTISQLICRGGGQSNKTVNITLGKNTKVTTIIKACADAIGLPLVIKESDFASVPPYTKGATIYGDPTQYLNDLAKTHDFSYVVINDKIRVTKNTGYIDGSVREVSQFTGMIGFPEISENGCDVSIIMNPRVKIGGRINIKSELKTFNFSNVYYRKIPPKAGTGVYRVFKVIHNGDSWTNTWNTQITAFR